MRIFTILFIVFWMASTQYAIAQGQIRGRVRDYGMNESVVGGTIYVLPQDVDKKNQNQKITAISQEDGDFVIENVPAGVYDLECYAPGFVTQRIVGFQVKNDQTKLAYFRMKVGSASKQGIDIVHTYASLQAKQKSEITTASQTEESLFDAPATVYLVSEKEIEERGYNSIIDLLQDIPEIEVHDKSDPEIYNTITVRGIQGNERLLIMVDGIRVSSAASSFHAIDQNFPIHYVAQVEVLIGPVSSLYGSDAFNGVINIITKKGNDIRGVTVKGGYGMYHSSNNAAVFGVGNKDVNVAITGSYFRSNEPYMPKYYPQEFDWYNNQYQTLGNVRVSPFSNDTTNTALLPYDMRREAYALNARGFIHGVEVGASYRKESHSSTVGSMPEFYPPSSESRYGTSIANAYARYNLKGKNEKWTLESIVQWNYFEINPSSKFNNSYSGYKDAYKFGFDNNALIRENFSYKLHKNHKVSAGLSGKYTYALPKTSDLPFQWTRGQDADGITQYYLGTDVFDADNTDLRIYQSLFFMNRFNVGGLLMYQGNFFKDKLSLSFAGRFDYNSDYGFTRNPRAALVYKPSSNFRLKLTYGEAFLAPSPQKEYDHFGALIPIRTNNGDITGFEGGYWRLPNNELLPEKLRSIDIGAVYTKGDLVIGGDVYTSSATNLIEYEVSSDEVFRGINIAVAERPQNTGSAFYFGGSASINYRVLFGAENDIALNLWGSASYSSGASKDSSKYVIDLPQLSARLNAKAGATFRYKGLIISTRAQYRTVSRAFENNAAGITEIPAYFVLHAFAKYEIAAKKVGIAIFAGVSNATNTRYYNGTLSGASNYGASPQDPIRITGGLEFTFGGR